MKLIEIIIEFAFTHSGVVLIWNMIGGVILYLIVDWIIDEIKRRSSKKDNY